MTKTAKKTKVLIIEPHSDDGVISIGGFLEKYRNQYEYHFMLCAASDMPLHHNVGLSRKQRLEEYHKYVSYFDGIWHQGKINGYDVPLDFDCRLDQFSRKDLVAIIENVINKVEPEILMIQGPSFHHDHTAIYEATIAATRPTARFCPKEIYIMENPTYVHSTVPQSRFIPDCYIALTEEIIAKKLKCFKELFPSQIREDANYLSEEGIRSWARYRGMEARCKYAEALHTYIRVI